MVDTAVEEKRRMLLEQEKTRCSSIIAGVVVTVIMLGTAVAMLVLERIFENRDFYIVAGIFGAGGIIFGLIFIGNSCRRWLKG